MDGRQRNTNIECRRCWMSTRLRAMLTNQSSLCSTNYLGKRPECLNLLEVMKTDADMESNVVKKYPISYILSSQSSSRLLY